MKYVNTIDGQKCRKKNLSNKMKEKKNTTVKKYSICIDRSIYVLTIEYKQ